MKNLFIVLVALCISVLTSSFIGNNRKSIEKLTVSVSGIPSIKGNVYVLLYNQPIGYPTNPAKAYKKMSNKVKGNNQKVIFEDIPYGKYSVVVFHDQNSNANFDKSWFGSPKESYGFSNIPNNFCGTPSFQQTAFNINDKINSIDVELIVVK